MAAAETETYTFVINGITKSSVGHYGTGKGADAMFPIPTK